MKLFHGQGDDEANGTKTVELSKAHARAGAPCFGTLRATCPVTAQSRHGRVRHRPRSRGVRCEHCNRNLNCREGFIDLMGAILIPAGAGQSMSAFSLMSLVKRSRSRASISSRGPGSNIPSANPSANQQN